MGSTNRIAYPQLTLLPNPVLVTTGQTTASVLAIWSMVSLGYAPISFISTLRTGSATGTIVATGGGSDAGGSYTFSAATNGLTVFAVFVDPDGNEFINDNVVQFQTPAQAQSAPATVAAAPNPILVANGQGTGATFITWDATPIAGVTSTSLVSGGATVATSASPTGSAIVTAATNGQVFTVKDQSGNVLVSTTVELEVVTALPTLATGTVSARYPVTVNMNGSTSIIVFENFSEQRWTERPQLAQFELTYKDVSAYDTANMQAFFISKKGDYIDDGLSNCFSVTLSPYEYTFCRFTTGVWDATEETPGLFSFTLKIEQVRVN